MKLDPTKPVQTRGGKPVRILCADRADSAYPIVGLVMLESGYEEPEWWMPDGSCYQNGSSDEDLINVPEKHVMYFNVYKGDCKYSIRYSANGTREQADLSASGIVTRIACIRVEFEEGQFDD